MANTMTKTIINCETNEVEIVPLTAEEIAQHEADAIAFAEQKAQEEAEAEAKAEAKASALAKLTALGLTEDEAKAIAG
jgi:hypothetical protein